MIRRPNRTLWLISAFLLGIALGGFLGWRLARRSGSGQSSSSESSAVAVSAHSRGRSASAGFTPSGDPGGDFHRIQRLRDAASRNTAFRQLLDSMSPDGIVRLMKALKQYDDDQEQEDQAGGLMALMASRQMVIEHAFLTDPAAVLAALSAAGDGMRNGDFYKDVLRGWAERDPEAARRFFEQHTLHDQPADAKAIAGALVRELVKTDPEGTFRWLRGLKAGFTDDVAHDALQTLSHYDGVMAGRLLAENNDLKKAPEFVEAMTAGWARTEPEKALDWALKLPSNIASGGIMTASGIWAEKDFSGALAAAAALHGEQRAAALNGIASRAGAKHVTELLPLVQSLPESADRASAVGSLMNSWVDESPGEASAWLTAQPEGASRDQGAMILALKTLDGDPESALEWAAAIGARDQREQGVDGLLDAWLKKDPRAARAWVLQSGRLSESDRARLLEKTGR